MWDHVLGMHFFPLHPHLAGPSDITASAKAPPPPAVWKHPSPGEVPCEEATAAVITPPPPQPHRELLEGRDPSLSLQPWPCPPQSKRSGITVSIVYARGRVAGCLEGRPENPKQEEGGVRRSEPWRVSRATEPKVDAEPPTCRERKGTR